MHELLVILVNLSWAANFIFAPYVFFRNYKFLKYSRDHYKNTIWPGKTDVSIWDGQDQMRFYVFLFKRKYINTVDMNDVKRFESERRFNLFFCLLMFIAVASFLALSYLPR